MERDQIQIHTLQAHLDRVKNLPRYDSAFKLLWGLCQAQNLDPSILSCDDVATQLLLLHEMSPSQARNAYSAMLHLPGFSSLQFNVLLKKVKKEWSSNQAKYTNFWDGSQILQALAQKEITWSSKKQVRDRLIMCLRLIQLMRSIDLQRTFRSISFIDKHPYILLRRKGWQQNQWEPLVSLPECPHISPWHLADAYVKMTYSEVPQGSTLLRGLVKPYVPLTSNTIASITKTILQQFHLQHWGAHSTRGAGVKMYKKMGMGVEQLCELGKWKNLDAFSKHYLRMDAHTGAQSFLQALVHTASPGQRAMDDRSYSPGKGLDQGRCDLEDIAQRHGEPTPPSHRKNSKDKDTGKKDPPLKFTFAKPRNQPL